VIISDLAKFRELNIVASTATKATQNVMGHLPSEPSQHYVYEYNTSTDRIGQP